MMVVFAIAMASVLGVAILASTSMQTQVKGNIVTAAQADYTAEAGLNVGVYYLQHPAVSGSVDASGMYAGSSSITFGNDFPGYVGIAVANVATNTYDITSTAHVSTHLTRSATARVYVNKSYVQTKALSTSGSFTMPSFMSVQGDVRVDGSLNVTSGATITGAVQATSATNYSSFTAPDSYPTRAAPTLAQISLYSTTGAATPYYTYVDVDGTTKTGYPQLLPATAVGTFVPAVNNPKNVWYSNNSVNLASFTINGTIVLRGATRRLTVFDTAHITARSNMPAIVAAGTIAFASDSLDKELVVDGLVWTGKPIGTNGAAATGCTLQINGALLLDSSVNGISANYDGTINVSYDATKVQVPNFSTVGTTPQSVRILRWGN